MGPRDHLRLEKGKWYESSNKRVFKCVRVVGENACMEIDGVLVIYGLKSNIWVDWVALNYDETLEYLVREVQS